jgi:exopolysaccharide biosynthesis polyprenyl glycosylphosphotransferase
MRRSWLLWVFSFIIDIGLVNLGYLLAFLLKFGRAIPPNNLGPFVDLIPYISLCVLVCFWFFELYSHTWKRRMETLYSVVITVLLTNISAMAITFMLRDFAFPRSIFIMAAILQICLLGVWRLLWQAVLDRSEGEKTVVVVGSNGQDIGRKLGSLLGGRRYQVLGLFNSTEEVDGGAFSDAFARAQVVCINHSISREAREDLIARCLEEDKEVLLVPELYDILLHNASLNRVDDLAVFHIESLALTPGQQQAKRLFDLVFSLVGLVLFLPFMLVISAAVEFSTPGHLFYRQKRVGLNGKTFSPVKFRTMFDDAEKDLGPVLATADDPRITPVGRLLRPLRLDELPQMINVLKGEMSFVGPRPERPFFVEQFCRDIPEYHYRLKVKPGITGLAQVQGKYDSDAADKLRYDLYYIRNYSLLLDLQIIFQTLRVVLIPEAAMGVSGKPASRDCRAC